MEGRGRERKRMVGKDRKRKGRKRVGRRVEERKRELERKGNVYDVTLS